MSSKLIDLLSSSVIIQGIVSLLFVATFCYQEIVFRSVDADLKIITVGIVTFWLGGKAVLMSQHVARLRGIDVKQP